MDNKKSATASRSRGLLATKLQVPKSPSGLVPRPRLISALEQHRDARVTLLAAPAGYGKTTLVAQWLDEDASPPTAWLTIDQLDNDLERFSRYVVAALDRVEQNCLAKTQELVSARNLPGPEGLAESIACEIERLGSPVVLVLEEYGLIHEPEVHELVSALVNLGPTNLRLVLTTRVDPPLPLGLWRSRQWLSELRAADLRFLLDETDAFFDGNDAFDLNDDEIAVIHRKTEGWVTGLRLAQLSLSRSSDVKWHVADFSASDRLITDYLMEQVLDGLPADVERFLAVTSVLERFSPDLCDELLAELDIASSARSRDILDRLYNHNVFLVALDPNGGWYRYHGLFRELLLERFDSLAPSISEADILSRAGHWFSDEGQAEDAFKCFLAAGDLDAAEDIFGQRLNEVITEDLSRRELARWIELFPSGSRRNRVPLLLGAAYLASLRSDFAGTEEILEEIEAISGETASERQRRWRAEIRDDMDFLHAFASYWRGDVEQTYRYSSSILDRGFDTRSFVMMSTLNYFGGSLALTGRWADYERFIASGSRGARVSNGLERLPYLVVKAAVHLYRGELQQAEAAASSLTSRSDFAVPKYWEAVGYLLLGIVSYERNHLGKAEGYFINVQSRRYDSPGLAYAGAATGLVRIELARGDIEGAERHVNAARVFADETKSSMLQLASEAAARYLDIAVGRSLDASAAPPPVADFMHVAVSAPSHSWAWAALNCPAEGMSQAALDYIDAALRLAEEHGVTRIAIQLMVLRALALDARQDRDGATSVLAAALQRAAPLGLARSFLDCGEGACTLLQDVAQRHPDNNYAAMLIDAYATEEKSESGRAAPLTAGTAGTRGAVNSGGAAGIEQLTNREIDVLELLTKRFSNKEIARQLGVSASTIKTHTLNIYLKLGVKGRRQAAAEATKRNLLPH